MERDKFLMDFSTVAATQAKLITHLKTSVAGDRSMTATDNTTLPWTGSITTGISALTESRWHHQGAKPKTSAPPAAVPQSRSASSGTGRMEWRLL